MMAGPQSALQKGLKAKLSVAPITDLVEGIYNSVAPPGKSLPVVIFQLQGGGDDNLTSVRNRSPVYTVKCIAKLEETALTVSEKIDDALHEQTLTVAGWTNYRTAREGDINYTESDETGQVIYHIGGMYRIRISE
jgi:hypothetical protein